MAEREWEPVTLILRYKKNRHVIGKRLPLRAKTRLGTGHS